MVARAAIAIGILHMILLRDVVQQQRHRPVSMHRGEGKAGVAGLSGMLSSGWFAAKADLALEKLLRGRQFS